MNSLFDMRPLNILVVAIFCVIYFDFKYVCFISACLDIIVTVQLYPVASWQCHSHVLLSDFLLSSLSSLLYVPCISQGISAVRGLMPILLFF